MTGFELHSSRVHALGQKPLKVGIDGLIELGDGIPGGFRAPGRDRGPSGKDRGCRGPLYGIEHFGLFRIDAVGEILRERFLGQSGEAVVFLDAGPRRPGREFPGQCDEILVGVGRACGDVDQCGDFTIGADFADDRSAPRVRD
jgi:hypothetical protein